MTAPTMEQMLADLERACAYANGSVPDARNALLARYAELERERDAYRAAAERWRYFSRPKFWWAVHDDGTFHVGADQKDNQRVSGQGGSLAEAIDDAISRRKK